MRPLNPSLTPQKLVRHYKDRYYIVKFESIHAETEEELTNYRALYSQMDYFSRPSAMFAGDVEYKGVLQPRFAPIHLGSAQDRQLFEILEFSSFAHRNQQLKFSNSPYFNHPVEVAASIAAHHPDVVDALAVKAALLHDVADSLEDIEELFGRESTKEMSLTLLDDIGRLFGPEIAGVVAELTDDVALPNSERRSAQIAKAGGKSKEASLVELADKLHDCRHLAKYLDPKQLAPFLCFSKKVVDGLPHLDTPLKKEFDDLFGKHLPKISSADFEKNVQKFVEGK